MARSIAVQASRAIPAEPRRAFDITLPIPLTEIFSRRYGLLPPVRQIRDQHGAWGQVGQSRTVVTADGGTMRELLTGVDAPHSFSYRVDGITGPLRPLVDNIDGRWEFTPYGTGTKVTWGWTLHATTLGAPTMPLVVRMWRGYARQALEQLSEQLLTPDPGQAATGSSA